MGEWEDVLRDGVLVKVALKLVRTADPIAVRMATISLFDPRSMRAQVTASPPDWLWSTARTKLGAWMCCRRQSAASATMGTPRPPRSWRCVRGEDDLRRCWVKIAARRLCRQYLLGDRVLF